MSHSSADAAQVACLADSLQALGVSAWVATRQIRIGDNYAERICGAIEDASAVVVVMSASALKSEHVKREVSLALTLHKPLMPVALRDLPADLRELPADWRYWLGVVQIVQATSEGEAARVVAESIGFSSAPADSHIPPPESGHARRPSTGMPELSSKMESRVRSVLIQTAAAAGTVRMAVDRARRLGASSSDVRAMAGILRDAGLLTFDGDPESETVIRLT